MQAIEQEFVDLNELRVATDLEIQELLGARYPQIEERVAMITAVAQQHLRERAHAEPRPAEDDQQARRPPVPPRPAGDSPVRRGLRDALRLRRPGLSAGRRILEYLNEEGVWRQAHRSKTPSGFSSTISRQTRFTIFLPQCGVADLRRRQAQRK